MQYRVATPLLLSCLFLMGQGYNAQFTSTTAAPGGGAPDVLAAMDFDDSASSSVCTDSQGGGWVGGVDNSGNCQGSAIDGSTYSGDVNAANSALVEDTAAFTEETTGWVTADLLFYVVQNGGSTVNPSFELLSDAAQSCHIRLTGTPQLKVRSADGTQSGGTNISDSTLYYIRLRYDIDSDYCQMLVSASNWGSSDVGSQVADGATGVAVSGWRLNQSAFENLWDLAIDEVRICDGDYGTTAGACVNS